MRLSRVFAAALLLAAVSAVQQAQAFTLDDQSANNSDGTPRFADPDEQGEAMANPSGFSTFSFGGQSGSSDDSFAIGNQSLPSSAQLGAGDHGFNNFTQYGHH